MTDLRICRKSSRNLLALLAVTSAVGTHVLAAEVKATPPPVAATKAPPPAAPAALPGPAAKASDVVRLEELEVRADRATALTQAPTEGDLDATQPKSTINLSYIANSVAPTADYSTIANIAPSVANVVTNGPGLSDAKRATIRGFSDAEYNLTYDGIPFADTNDFTHHTTSYFPAKMIGRVIIERGPGTASNIGNATFGGTLALLSKDPRTDSAVIPTLSFGSYGTTLAHIEGNTGLMHSLKGGSIIASYQHMATDGFQSNVSMSRDTTYIKYLQPVGTTTTLTFLSNYNSIKFNNPLPITQSPYLISGVRQALDIDTYGRDAGLLDDPKSPFYSGYNHRDNKTDFEYIGIDTTLGGTWHLEDKIYTYYYGNASYDTASIGTKSWNLGNNVGRYKVSNYRAWGNTFIATHDDQFGTLKTGFWFERHRSVRYQYGVDYTKGTVLDYNSASASVSPRSAYLYDMINYLESFQVFAEHEIRIGQNLMINPGLKYLRMERVIDASINQTTKALLNTSAENTKVLPYLSANYSIQQNWTAYAQAAKGLLGPNLNQFYVPNPSKNQIKPQETVNYQVGTTCKTEKYNISADYYYINENNVPLKLKDPVNNDDYFSVAKGAYYYGAEAELTVLVAKGTSLYANASKNYAEYKLSKLDIPGVASSTAALGIIYDHKGLFGSIISKYVGSSLIYEGTLNPDVASSVTGRVTSEDYWLTDLSVGYALKLSGGKWARSLKLRFQVNNIFDQDVLVVDSLKSGISFYNALPNRNYFMSLSGEF